MTIKIIKNQILKIFSKLSNFENIKLIAKNKKIYLIKPKFLVAPISVSIEIKLFKIK